MHHAVHKVIHAKKYPSSPKQERQNSRRYLQGKPQETCWWWWAVAKQNIGSMHGRSRSFCHGYLYHVNHRARRCQTRKRHSLPRKQDVIPNFRRFILNLLLLFTDSSGHVPCNFHIRVQRKRFPLHLTIEAFNGFNSILCIYSFYLDFFLHRTFLHPQGSTEICSLPVVYRGLPTGNIFCHGSVSTLLSFGVGYLQEGATTWLQGDYPLVLFLRLTRIYIAIFFKSLQESEGSDYWLIESSILYNNVDTGVVSCLLFYFNKVKYIYLGQYTISTFLIKEFRLQFIIGSFQFVWRLYFSLSWWIWLLWVQLI